MWETLTSNSIINAGFLAWSLAQILKTIITLFATKKVRLERLIGAGGMPSSHSALATSVAVAMLRKMGFASPEFALSAAFALIVMYDAMGVRRAAGEQAKVLNRIVLELPQLPWLAKKEEKYIEIALEDIPKEPVEQAEPEDETPLNETKLKELLGHTPFEVLGGMILGIIVAVLMPVK